MNKLSNIKLERKVLGSSKHLDLKGFELNVCEITDEDKLFIKAIENNKAEVDQFFKNEYNKPIK